VYVDKPSRDMHVCPVDDPDVPNDDWCLQIEDKPRAITAIGIDLHESRGAQCSINGDVRCAVRPKVINHS